MSFYLDYWDIFQTCMCGVAMCGVAMCGVAMFLRNTMLCGSILAIVQLHLRMLGHISSYSICLLRN